MRKVRFYSLNLVKLDFFDFVLVNSKKYSSETTFDGELVSKRFNYYIFILKFGAVMMIFISLPLIFSQLWQQPAASAMWLSLTMQLFIDHAEKFINIYFLGGRVGKSTNTRDNHPQVPLGA